MQPDFSSLYASLGSRVADLPGFGTNWGSFADLGMAQYEERVHNSWMGLGFRTNEDLGGPPGARLRGFGVRYPDADGTVRGGNWTLEEAIRNSEGVGTVFASWDDAYVDGDMDPDAIPLPDDFRVRVENRLKTVQPGQSKSCNDFMPEVIAKVIQTRNAENLALSQSNGGTYTEQKPEAGDGLQLLGGVKEFKLVGSINDTGAIGTIDGSLRQKNATVKILQRYSYTGIRGYGLDMQTKSAVGIYVRTAIHELMHLAGGSFSDGRLALAVYDLGYSKIPVPDPDTENRARQNKHSGDWDAVLSRYCGN